MNTSKSALLKSLRPLSSFDPSSSPYVGLQMREQQALFHRSSPNGFIQTAGYNRRAGCTVVSLSHLLDCLKAIGDEQVNLSRDDSGILRLQSVESAFSDDLRVHTIRDTDAWTKVHDCGTIASVYDSTLLAPVAGSSFTLSVQPVLRAGRMMLATDHGVICRDSVGGKGESYEFYPREVFLRSLPGEVDRLFQTAKGYWGATCNGLELMVAGHRSGNGVFEAYSGPATHDAVLPSSRVLSALSSAINLCGEGQVIQLHPKVGVSTQDQFRNTANFSLGEALSFTPFQITPRSASVMVSALGQSKDENIILSSLDARTRRVRRGEWEVNFRGQ